MNPSLLHAPRIFTTFPLPLFNFDRRMECLEFKGTRITSYKIESCRRSAHSYLQSSPFLTTIICTMYPSRPSLAFALLPDEENAHGTRDKHERIPGVSRRFRRAFGGKKTIGAVWSIVFVCLTWWGVTKNLERMKVSR
jgi:hypothetical protein